MKYEQQILESFAALNKSPRGTQLETINQILEAYIDQGKTNVVLSAPTGSGKSIIGAVVADTLHRLIHEESLNQCASFILMGTNVLTEQYAQTFDKNKNFILVKGANNYKCDVLSDDVEFVGADNCCHRDMKKSQDRELISLVENVCVNCEFQKIKRAKHVTNHLITNFSYFFIDRMFTKQHSRRTITVWDEAHTLNDAFAEHCAIYISESRLAKLSEEMAEQLKFTDTKIFNTIQDIKKAIVDKKINDENYLEYIEKLQGLYRLAKDRATDLAKSVINSDIKLYTKLNKLGKRYGDYVSKIDDLLDYNYEHIFELNEKLKEVTVKPIFVGQMFQPLINSDFQLFMSATISDKLLYDTFEILPEHTAFIKMPSAFPIENKKVVFFNIEKLNYATMKDSNVQKKLITACKKLTEKHINENESGIILTPSFDVTEMIARQLTVKTFEHKRGTKLADVVEAFKKCKSPAVLLSPSMFEGISLDDDLSRFQIFVKAPYASLGEKRTKYIAENHSSYYTLQTILKIIQGAGRSVRHIEDHAVTYCLDTSLSFLWKNNLNVWKDEFYTTYQTLI